MDRSRVNADAESSGLPIISPPEQPSRGKRSSGGWWLPACRIMVLAGILLCVREHHLRESARLEAMRNAPDVTLESIQEKLPSAAKIDAWQPNGSAQVLDADFNRVGLLVHTNDVASQVIGYVGATRLLIVFQDQKVCEVTILESEDTVEHVAAIQRDGRLLDSWDGLTWEQIGNREKVEAVSGATLTSFAIVETMVRRFGGETPNFKFPTPVQLGEIQPVFPQADSISQLDGSLWREIKDGQDNVIGFAVRSSPTVDDVIGYQGPTDFLVLFDENRRFKRLLIRSSFDNEEPEPFVRYVSEDEYFTVDQFAGMSVRELTNYEPDAFEGISGATMTSSGVFAAMQKLLAKAAAEEMESSEVSAGLGLTETTRRLVFTLRDLGTLFVLIVAVIVCFTKASRWRWMRIGFQIVLVGYFGFLNGDLISQLLLVGWAKNGIPWNTAMGLTALTAAAFTVPFFSRRNLYCQHVCPFGVLQHWTRRFRSQPFRISKRLLIVLKTVPWLVFGLVVTSLLFGWNLNLAALEPFDAFSIRIAGTATIVLAVSSLLVSIWIPMGYCRFGCPTGAILGYTRRSNKPKLGARDAYAILLLGIALVSVAH